LVQRIKKSHLDEESGTSLLVVARFFWNRSCPRYWYTSFPFQSSDIYHLHYWGCFEIYFL